METLQLVEQLNEMIADGVFPENSRLPAERELSQTFGVTRGRLRKALALLEAEGKIWRHVGKGTFVGHPPLEEASSVSVLTKTTNPMEVMEMRLVIEPRMAGFAAIRATPVMIAGMYRCVEKSQPPTDLYTYELWDATLHRTIAQAAQNKLLLSVLDIVNAMRQERLWGQLKERAVTTEKMSVYTAQHIACIEAIEARNIRAAEQTMIMHLELVKEDLILVSS